MTQKFNFVHPFAEIFFLIQIIQKVQIQMTQLMIRLCFTDID